MILAILLSLILLEDNFSNDADQPSLKSEMTKEMEEIYAKTIEHRDKLKSCEMEITTTYTHDKNGPVNGSSVFVKLYVDGDKIRAERHHSSKRFNIDSNQVYCDACINVPDCYLFFDNYSTKQNPNVNGAIQFADKALLRKEDPKYFFPDFRYLACSMNMTPKTKEPLLDFFYDKLWLSNSPGPIIWKVDIADDLYRGVKCKKIKQELPGTLRTTWISPEQGYSLRRIEQKICDREGNVLECYEIEVEVAQNEKSSLWFPSKWNFYKKSVDGVETSNKGEIRVTSLNQPIDPARFTMQDIELIPAGADVIWALETEKLPPEWKLPLIWDGKNVINKGVYSEEIINERKSESSNRRLLIISVNVILISSFAIIYLCKKMLINKPVIKGEKA